MKSKQNNSNTAEAKGPVASVSFGKFSGELEKVSCPTCIDPPHPRLVFRKSEGIGIWRCGGCGIMYASPRFTEASLLKIYENEAFADLSFYGQWNYDRWKKENRNRSYVTQVLKLQLVERFLSAKGKVLDVGCGTGLFCLEASRHGLEIEGIDPSHMLTEIGRKVLKVSVKQGLLEDHGPGFKYSGIVVWDVLEHVYNPVGLVKKCHELTEPGGHIFVQVPNYDGASNRMKTFLCRRGLKKSDFKHFGFPWHLYAFNRKSLAALLRIAGFVPVFFESWSHFLKDGTRGFHSRVISSVAKRLCLSDYITCVARKDG